MGHSGTRGKRCDVAEAQKGERGDERSKGLPDFSIVFRCARCELSIVQKGLPAAIPPEACYLGWQESLILLAKLVEAEIQD